MWGLEEGSYKAMDSPLQAPIDEQNRRLPHQLRERFGVRRHESLCIALKNKLTHFCIRRNNCRTPKYV